jgi:hypothetical protein
MGLIAFINGADVCDSPWSVLVSKLFFTWDVHEVLDGLAILNLALWGWSYIQ